MVSKYINYICNAVLLTLPMFFWYRYTRKIKELERKYQESELFRKKHNCVVIYCKERGMSGWPDYEGQLKLSLDNMNKFYEPIIYFINTAKISISIAVMLITSSKIVEALSNASKRGLTVRIILDFNTVRKHPCIKVMQNNGIQILFYVVSKNHESIFHYKYALKDYDINDGSGFVLCGSLNWTGSGIMENYENVVFTTSKSCVNALHENFEETWKYVDNEKNTNSVVKAILQDNLCNK